jgi:hypothetical protein
MNTHKTAINGYKVLFAWWDSNPTTRQLRAGYSAIELQAIERLVDYYLYAKFTNPINPA